MHFLTRTNPHTESIRARSRPNHRGVRRTKKIVFFRVKTTPGFLVPKLRKITADLWRQ